VALVIRTGMMEHVASTSPTVPTSDSARECLEQAVAGRYRIEERIGRGQFSSVYRASSVSRGGDVAIKLLDADVGSKPELVRRIEDELRASMSLGDVRIVAAATVEQHEGCCFLVMPLMKQGSLAARIRERGALPLSDVERIIGEVAATLHGMHEHGLVHGGLTPENILFDGAGHACIVDAGLTETLLATGSIHGSRASLARRYAAPEQWRAQKVDGRADQYALARIGYEMLTGGQREQQEIVEGVHTLTPIEVFAHVPLRKDVPLRVNAALRRALSANAANRFASVRDFVNALTGRAPDAIQGLPTAYPVLELRARHPVLKVGGALAVVTIIVLAVDPSLRAAALRAGHALIGQLGGNHRQMQLSVDAAPTAPSSNPISASDGSSAKTTRGTRTGPATLPARPSHSGVPISSNAVSTDSSINVSSDPVAVRIENPGSGGTLSSIDSGGEHGISGATRFLRDGTSWFKRIFSGAFGRGENGQSAYIHVAVDKGNAVITIDGLPRGAAPLTVSVSAGHHTISALGELSYGVDQGVNASGGDTANVLLHAVRRP
jgi:serine/threonine protein kinase